MAVDTPHSRTRTSAIPYIAPPTRLAIETERDSDRNPVLSQMLPVSQALPAVCQFSDSFPASLGEDRNGLVLGGRRHDEDYAAPEGGGHDDGAGRQWMDRDRRGYRSLNEWDLMGLIGHELQHAIEVLGDRTVTSNAAMFFFYRRIGKPHPKHFAFETDAAIALGEAVRTEARKYRPGAEAR